MEFSDLTITKAAELLSRKELSAVELAQMSLDRINKLEHKISAFLHVAQEHALAQARKADQAIKDGAVFPLTGIPFAAKDNILVRGMPATAASKILESYIPPFDATIIKKLQTAVPVLVGKTNLDEFAMGVSTENSAFGPSKNPYDVTKVPGGSSGGSAAAVASSEVLFGLGTDTGGSVRGPAAFCGLVGLKPTYGRCSRYGLIALGSSLDQPGVLAKTVEDAFLVFQLMAGQDEFDSTTLPKPVPDYSKFKNLGVKGMKVGVPKEYFIDGLNPEVKAAVMKAVEQMQSLGAIVEETSLPHVKYSISSYYIILPVEISANLSRYDGIRYGTSIAGKDLAETYLNTRSQKFGMEPKRRIMIGTYASSAGYFDAYYKKAKQAQSMIRKEFTEAFEKYDLLITPTTPGPAFGLGEKSSDPLSLYLEDIFTVALNISGVPGMSLPVGVTKSGLPIGAQLITGHFKEEKLLQAGYALEQALNLNLKPKL